MIRGMPRGRKHTDSREVIGLIINKIHLFLQGGKLLPRESDKEL
jgi:hypothetical protein